MDTFANTRYGAMRVFENDDPIGLSLLEYGEWAENELRVLCSFIGPGSHVVDVGANIGTHTLAFARQVGFTGSVLAIEPQRAVFDLLEHNVSSSNAKQIRTLRSAVGSTEGELSVPSVDYGGKLNVGAVKLRPINLAEAEERVPLISLDKLRLSACHLVKVDAEGFGAKVLEGMRKTIARTRPVVAAECSSVEEGAELLRVAQWPKYDLIFLRSAAYNKNNYASNGDNFFGVATETTLLFLPHELLHLLPVSEPGAELVAISDLDQLAAAILASPRYGDITAHDRDVAWLGQALQAAEARLLEVQTRLEFRNAALTSGLRTAQEELRDAQEQLRAEKDHVASLESQIATIRASISWRLTGPIRRAARLLRALQ